MTGSKRRQAPYTSALVPEISTPGHMVPFDWRLALNVSRRVANASALEPCAMMPAFCAAMVEPNATISELCSATIARCASAFSLCSVTVELSPDIYRAPMKRRERKKRDEGGRRASFYVCKSACLKLRDGTTEDASAW